MLERAVANRIVRAALVAYLAACGSNGSAQSPDADTSGAPADADTSGAPPDATERPDAAPPMCAEAADCDDGVYCNGEESCDPSSDEANSFGCVAGEPPCGSGRTCEEETEACHPACEIDPDVDDDGADAVACGGTDCDDAADGFVEGEDWANCEACGSPCGEREACDGGSCIEARRVFVTSTGHDGDLGGAAGADEFCQDHADGAELGGSWKAYLVDGDENLSRHVGANVPYVRLDGVRIADDWGDLTDESIQEPLNIDENRQTYSSNVWTGIADTGRTCEGWTSSESGCVDDPAAPCGTAGESSQTNDHWDGEFVFSCSVGYRVYCIEQ